MNIILLISQNTCQNLASRFLPPCWLTVDGTPVRNDGALESSRAFLIKSFFPYKYPFVHALCDQHVFFDMLRYIAITVNFVLQLSKIFDFFYVFVCNTLFGASTTFIDLGAYFTCFKLIRNPLFCGWFCWCRVRIIIKPSRCFSPKFHEISFFKLFRINKSSFTKNCITLILIVQQMLNLYTRLLKVRTNKKNMNLILVAPTNFSVHLVKIE